VGEAKLDGVDGIESLMRWTTMLSRLSIKLLMLETIDGVDADADEGGGGGAAAAAAEV